MKRGTALVISGGGLGCSWSVGALLALVKKYNFTSPDILIAGSGSAGTGAYFVSGQYDSIENIWSNLLSTSKFVSLKRLRKVINIDYLIDEVFKKQDPLDTSRIYKSKIDFLIPLTDAHTGEVKYFSNRDRQDIFEILRASKAMPFFYGKKIKIRDRYYIDSRFSTRIELHLQKAISMGAKNIIAINTSGLYRPFKLIFDFFIFLKSLKQKQFFKENLDKIKTFKYPEDINIVFLSPNSSSKIATFNNKQEVLKKNIEDGLSYAEESEELKEFFR